MTRLDCTCLFGERLCAEGLLCARRMLVHKTEMFVLFVGRKQGMRSNDGLQGSPAGRESGQARDSLSGGADPERQVGRDGAGRRMLEVRQSE